MLAPIYRVYEHRLVRQVRAFPVPRHIGLILDGNRRFGRLNGLRHPDDVYMAGANKLDDLLDWCIDLEIPAITLWVFSTENRKRPAPEVTGILAAGWPSRVIAAVNARSRARSRSCNGRLYLHASDNRCSLWWA